MTLATLQFATAISVVLGLASFWFETNGLLGSVIFTFFIVTTLGNTLLPAEYHKAFIAINVILVTILGIFELKSPNYVINPYPSIFAAKIFSLIVLITGIVVCGAIISYFKYSYAKTHEKLSSQNEKLQKTNHELDNLIYSISHDLRAPIMSVMGLVSLHKSIAKDAEAQKYIALEERSLHNLDKFIQDLLAYSRVNRMEVYIEEIDLPHLLHDIAEQYKYVTEKKVEIRINCLLSQAFFSDKTKLQIALQNLIGNAINYADFEKEMAYCEINVTEIGANIEIEIADNGVGIDEKHGSKIFDMFYRANQKTKGSGLGLYIVKEAIEKVHGTIRFESKLGEGTRFFLNLPI